MLSPATQPPYVLTLILLVATMLAIGCEDASHDSVTKPDDTATTKEIDEPPSLVAQYQRVGEILQLKQTEIEAIQAIHDNHKSLLVAWQNDAGAKLQKIQAKALNAAKNRDLKALREMNASGAKQKAADWVIELRTMKKTYEADLLQALPADKLDQWKTHLVSTNFLELLKPLKLSADQIEKVNTHAAQAVTQVKNESNWLVLASVKLSKQFADDVSPEQKAAFKKLMKTIAIRQLGSL